MKKSILFFLVLCLSCPFGVASASPAAHSAYQLSFEGNMTRLCPDPIGRWMDELMALISLRAECIAWEGGSITRLDFLVDGAGAASIAVFELGDDLFLSGNLFPEMPRLPDEGQRIAASAMTEALFPSMKSASDASQTSISADEFASAARTFAEFLRLTKASDHRDSDAFADLLDQFADDLSKDDSDTIAVKVTKAPDITGTPAMPDISCAADTAIERLLRALMVAISETA